MPRERRATRPVQVAMRCRDALLIGACVVLLPRAEAFYAAAPFYEGKTLTIIQGRSAGGLGDVRVRTAIPYLKKYLPGNPHIISIYVSSAGGIHAGNMMAKTIKNDGLSLPHICTEL